MRETLRKEKRVDVGEEARRRRGAQRRRERRDPPINPTLPSTARPYRFLLTRRKERAPPSRAVLSLSGELSPIKTKVAAAWRMDARREDDARHRAVKSCRQPIKVERGIAE